MKRVLNAGETRSTNKNGTKLNRETRCKCQIKSSTSYLRGASEPDKCVVPLSPLWTFKSLFLPELGGCVLWQNVRQLNSHGSLSWRWAPLLRSRSTGNWTNERKSLPVVPSACFFFFHVLQMWRCSQTRRSYQLPSEDSEPLSTSERGRGLWRPRR